MTAEFKTIAEGLEAVADVHVAVRGAVAHAKIRTKGAKVEGTDRVLTGPQLLKVLADRTEITVATQQGKRPKYVRCRKCRLTFPAPKTGTLPSVCKPCKIRKCSEPGCGQIICRQNRTGFCKFCNGQRLAAMLSPEQKRERMKRARAAQTREQQLQNMAKARKAITPTQRSQRAKKANASWSPDAKKKQADRMRDMVASLSADQLRERASKANAVRTKEARALSAHKAASTRRARKVAGEAA